MVSQLNAPDTAAHVHGPDSEAALAVYRETDARLALVRDHLDWDDTVWIVVSDHDQETVVEREPVDLRPAFARRGVDLFALPEGSATVVCGNGAVTRRSGSPTSRASKGRLRSTSPTPTLEACLAWCVPGPHVRVRRDAHRTRHARRPADARAGRGRHRRSPARARSLAPPSSRTVSAIDWAPTIATLLELALPDASGRSLV